MAPAAVGLLARSFSAFSCRSVFTRCCSVFSSADVNPVRYLSSQTSGPPKRPMNAFFRFIVHQKTALGERNPETRTQDVIKKIAQQWRSLSPEEKQPFQDSAVQDRESFKVELQKYQAQLTPDQLQQQTMEKRQRMAKRKALRKKMELTNLGKPKRIRSAFNVFISEHYDEGRGSTVQAKIKSLCQDWKNLHSDLKKVYTQLADDDRIRYENEMKTWEEHMVEIGREDLIRRRSQIDRKDLAEIQKGKKKKPRAVKKTAATKK